MLRLIIIFLVHVFTTVILAENSGTSFTDFKAEVIKELDAAEKKVTTLAKEIPQAKYTWRPDEGVRSISEVILHVGGANYFVLSFAGVKLPEGIKMESDFDKKTTIKEEILEYIAAAYSYVREKISTMKEKDLEKNVDFFGSKITVRHLLLKMISHNHEHLGQLIAYARMNGIIPPWSKKDE
ncbi:MAG: DinB family protein [Ignavibacteriaceae bacterium]|nr:DinB family protein [Ignavibacteriaceae bacterium]